ncbi:MAG: type II toxin-antitoxin system RelE/ParE family toxin [Flavobacteriia bacterium]|nr:type II toxin-antitoxin system RelE/ParE family toxin [Flavobacteriia bacterium]NBV92498.1 type II toxin-antitoxin system RelE/ParE family toxin [Flavobacteriia bacterium]NBY41244.1 type II toxin-antitoxin system RelE/ParE family toxin [Flavobacteriia bacterium]
MAKFKLTNSAVKDLSDIWNYTYVTWSESQADKYYKLILNACAAIAKKPLQGKVYEEIYPDLKGKKASKHIIFYRIMDDKSIEVTRILHERMELKNKLK